MKKVYSIGYFFIAERKIKLLPSITCISPCEICHNDFVIIILRKSIGYLRWSSLVSFAIEIVIPAPIDVVFDYVNNDEKIMEWSTFMVENRYPSNVDVKQSS